MCTTRITLLQRQQHLYDELHKIDNILKQRAETLKCMEIDDFLICLERLLDEFDDILFQVATLSDSNDLSEPFQKHFEDTFIRIKSSYRSLRQRCLISEDKCSQNSSCDFLETLRSLNANHLNQVSQSYNEDQSLLYLFVGTSCNAIQTSIPQSLPYKESSISDKLLGFKGKFGYRFCDNRIKSLDSKLLYHQRQDYHVANTISICSVHNFYIYFFPVWKNFENRELNIQRLTSALPNEEAPLYSTSVCGFFPDSSLIQCEDDTFSDEVAGVSKQFLCFDSFAEDRRFEFHVKFREFTRILEIKSNESSLLAACTLTYFEFAASSMNTHQYVEFGYAVLEVDSLNWKYFRDTGNFIVSNEPSYKKYPVMSMMAGADQVSVTILLIFTPNIGGHKIKTSEFNFEFEFRKIPSLFLATFCDVQSALEFYTVAICLNLCHMAMHYHFLSSFWKKGDGRNSRIVFLPVCFMEIVRVWHAIWCIFRLNEASLQSLASCNDSTSLLLRTFFYNSDKRFISRQSVDFSLVIAKHLKTMVLCYSISFVLFGCMDFQLYAVQEAFCWYSSETFVIILPHKRKTVLDIFCKNISDELWNIFLHLLHAHVETCWNMDVLWKVITSRLAQRGFPVVLPFNFEYGDERLVPARWKVVIFIFKINTIHEVSGFSKYEYQLYIVFINANKFSFHGMFISFP